MIQPGLIPLQPNFDFMDTFEPFQGKNPIYSRLSSFKIVVIYELFFNRRLNVADIYSL